MSRTTVPAALPSGKAGASFTTTIEIPPEALTIFQAPPETISQKTVLEVTGIPPRVYLTEIRRPGFPLPVMRLGKLRLVERAAFLAWLRTQTSVRDGDAAANDAEPTADPEADTDAVLAELGLERRVAGKGRGR